MDKIFIRNLTTSAIIGIHPWERNKKQTIIINLELATKINANDDIDEVIDYEILSNQIIKFIDQTQYKLIETLAEKISQHIFANCNTDWLQLQISKPQAISQAEGVGIIIQRQRSDQKT